jgi:hypothetical protein
MPMSFPSSGTWLLKILARDNRFVFGLYRRHMKVIGYLGTFDRLFGVPVTTRNWNTMTAIARVLGKGGASISSMKLTASRRPHGTRRRGTPRARPSASIGRSQLIRSVRRKFRRRACFS